MKGSENLVAPLLHAHFSRAVRDSDILNPGRCYNVEIPGCFPAVVGHFLFTYCHCSNSPLTPGSSGTMVPGPPRVR